jgi:hypothetical protein
MMTVCRGGFAPYFVSNQPPVNPALRKPVTTWQHCCVSRQNRAQADTLMVRAAPIVVILLSHERHRCMTLWVCGYAAEPGPVCLAPELR